MAELKSGYKHYPKDLKKFGYIDKEDNLTNLRFGNNSFIEIGRSDGQIARTLEAFLGLFASLSFIGSAGVLSILALLKFEYGGEWFAFGLILSGLYMAHSTSKCNSIKSSHHLVWCKPS